MTGKFEHDVAECPICQTGNTASCCYYHDAYGAPRKDRRHPWPYFFAASADRWLDGWTYGDWRQYICKRSDGALQPARLSHVSSVVLLLSALFLEFSLVVWFVGIERPERIIWSRLYAATALSGLGFAASIALMCSKWRLMRAVGPRSYDGVRRFPGEGE